jgi:hypothetical protein
MFWVNLQRGKTSGHDIDILITHPVAGEEKGILDKVIAKLGEMALLCAD